MVLTVDDLPPEYIEHVQGFFGCHTWRARYRSEMIQSSYNAQYRHHHSQ